VVGWGLSLAFSIVVVRPRALGPLLITHSLSCTQPHPERLVIAVCAHSLLPRATRGTSKSDGLRTISVRALPGRDVATGRAAPPGQHGGAGRRGIHRTRRAEGPAAAAAAAPGRVM
jgi:hypothetical protein